MADTTQQKQPNAPGAAAAPEETSAALARRWVDENLAGGVVARSTECWNAVIAALPALADLIDART